MLLSEAVIHPVFVAGWHWCVCVCVCVCLLVYLFLLFKIFLLSSILSVAQFYYYYMYIILGITQVLKKIQAIKATLSRTLWVKLSFLTVSCILLKGVSLCEDWMLKFPEGRGTSLSLGPLDFNSYIQGNLSRLNLNPHQSCLSVYTSADLSSDCH